MESLENLSGDGRLGLDEKVHLFLERLIERVRFLIRLNWVNSSICQRSDVSTNPHPELGNICNSLP